MQKTRPTLWILAPITLSLAVASIWASALFSPFGKPSRAEAECSALKSFITTKELTSRAQWNNYRDLVKEYVALPQDSNRASLVQEIAMTVVQVLTNDLAIYVEMNKNQGCLVEDRREQLPGVISETESAIKFLKGDGAIEGSFFEPQAGIWNTEYYSEFSSAEKFLKEPLGDKSDR